MKLASPHSDRARLLDEDALAEVTRMDQRNGRRRIETTRRIPSALTAEMATPEDDNPNLSAWTRARLAWARLLAGFTRRR